MPSRTEKYTYLALFIPLSFLLPSGLFFMTQLQLECIEEAGATPALIESYLTACHSFHNQCPLPLGITVNSSPASSSSRFKLVEGFCNSLEMACAAPSAENDQASDGENELLHLLPQILDTTLPSGLSQPTKPNLRTSPAKAASLLHAKKVYGYFSLTYPLLRMPLKLSANYQQPIVRALIP